MAETTRLPTIEIPGADAFNGAMLQYKEAIERALKISVTGSLQLSRQATGFQISAYPSERFVVLTSAASGTGQYNWTEVYPAASGGWTKYPTPLTGQAWEFNLTAGILTVTNPYYTKVKWYPTSTGGEWRFQAGLCTYIPPLPSFEWFQPMELPQLGRSSSGASAATIAITTSGGGVQSAIPIPP